MSFDPRQCGAQCDRCPLGPGNPFQSGDWAPLPADIEKGALGAVVVAGPTSNDASDGVRYLISGRDNRLWREALRAEGRERHDFSVVPLISCLAATGAQDEEGQWKKMDAKLKAINKKREAAGREVLLHPIEACRPRFRADIEPYHDIIAFEKEASKALTGDNSGIRSICGDLIALDSTGRRLADKDCAHRRVVPTVSPGFALKYPKWEQAFRANVAKALRWFEGRLRWTEPDITMEPTPEELDAWLSVPARYWCYDIETDGILVQTTRIRCIAVATPDTRDRPARAIGLTILGDGDMPVMDGAKMRRYLAVLKRHMTEADRPWVGHNATKFDNGVLEAQWGFSPGDNLRDSMFAARASNPDFPKGLKLWGRILTDVEAWETTEKGDDLATGNVSPESRLRYCCYDTVVNCRIFDPLVKVAHEKGMMRPLDERLKPEGWPGNLDFNLWNVDQEAQRRAKRMHERGIYIDEPRRKALVEDYTQRVAYHEAIVRDIMQNIGTKYNNPNSYDQIRDILYGKQHWDLPMPAGMKAREYFTDSGLPGTDDNVMRAYMVDASTNEVQRTMLYHLRLFRRYKNKVLGTVLLPLDPRRKPASVMAAMPTGYVDEREMSELLGEGVTLDDVEGTFVWPDGRVRSNWSAHVTSVGRYSSSKPNCFSGDTEVLTPEGWVRFDEYKPGTPVMEWEDGALRFTEPTGYVSYWSDEMVQIKLDQVDLRCTPHHRCLVVNRKTGERRVVRAEDYPAGYKQINAGVYVGGPTRIDDTLLRLIVATQADGSYKSGSDRISFAFSETCKIDRLCELLDAAGAKYSVYHEKCGTVTYYLPDQPLTIAIKSWLTPRKGFDWRILSLDRDNLDAFVDEVFFWGGGWTRKNKYASVTEQNVAVVQAVLALSDTRARMERCINNHGREFYRLGTGRHNYSLTSNRSLTREGGEQVYCVSVPSSFIMVRRNGCIAVTGQCQNIGNKKGSGPLKSIFAAGPDCILVGADLAQAHLYIAACDWGITPLLDTLDKGWDLHGAFAANVLGSRYTQADGWGPRGYDPKGKPSGGTAKAIRDMCKTFRYAWMYWASPPTIWAVMRGTEGDPADMARLRKALGREPVIKDFLAASMPYVDLELAKIIRMDKDAHRAEPHWARAWERQMNRFKRDGYIEEPVFGRRSGDLEGGKPQAVVNYGVLAAESSIMRIVEHRIEALFPETETETGRIARGLIHQCHDSVAVEVPLPRGYSKQDHMAWVAAVKAARTEKREPPPLHPALEEKRRLLESCMSVNVPGWPVAICGEADVGLTLKDV